MTTPTTDLLVIRAKTEPVLPGYRCIGFTSNTCWPAWVDWMFEVYDGQGAETETEGQADDREQTA